MDWSFDKPDVPCCVVYIFNKDDETLRRAYHNKMEYRQRTREMLEKIGMNKDKYLEENKHLTYEEWYDEFVVLGVINDEE